MFHTIYISSHVRRSAEVQKFKRQQEAGAQEIQKLKAERLHAMMNAQAEKKNVTCHHKNVSMARLLLLFFSFSVGHGNAEEI